MFLSISASAAWDTERDIMPLLAELKILQGDADGNLRLDDYVSRAEFAKIAVASSRYKNTVAAGMKISPFKDVKYTHWSAPYVQAAVSAGIVSGYMDGTFRPDNTVNYEEALTMMLTVLGYTDEDFGVSWPYGQIGLAQNLEITENVDASQGEPLTRRQVANLVYNSLGTNMKGTQNKLISELDCQIIEDVTITASGAEDASLGSGKIRTTSGVFNIDDRFNEGYVGRRGDIAVKNGKDFVSFAPSDQVIYDFTVTNVIGSDLVLDGNIVDISDSTTVYCKSNTTTYSQIAQDASKGDKFRIFADTNASIDYAILVKESGGATISDNLLDRYVIYSVLSDRVVCYNDGKFTELDIDDGTTCYRDSNPSTYGAMKSAMAMGDIIYVKRDGNDIDYVSFEKGNMEGPVKITSAGHLGGMSANADTAYMRDGNQISASELRVNDIVYYSEDLNMVLAYSTKVTGIYENASPSKDSPSSVTISGKTYNVEGVDAFNALSSSGSLRYGDTITVLLGRTGDVAGVMTENDTTAQYGYVISSGRKDFTNPDGTLYSSYYVKMVTPDGIENEYAVKNDGKDYVGRVCSVSFGNDGTKLSAIRGSSLSGRVNSNSMTVGSQKLADNVRILDTVKSPLFDTALYKRIFPQRLDGITLKSSDVVYCGKNSSGEITDLILENITGDAYSYGYVLSRTHVGINYSYTFDIDGSSYSYTSNNSQETYYQTDDNGNTVKDKETGKPIVESITTTMNTNLNTGPCMLVIENGAVRHADNLRQYSGAFKRLTATEVTIGSDTYKLSDKVLVYKKSGSTYMKIPLTEAIDNNYKVSAYYDKLETLGGRVRVLVAN